MKEVSHFSMYNNTYDSYNLPKRSYKNHRAEYVPENDVEYSIKRICDDMSDLLISKNRAYGNSALEPVRIFSKSDNIEQLKVRIDDKLSRFTRGTEFPGDNDINDLIGYLVLLKIALEGNK